MTRISYHQEPALPRWQRRLEPALSALPRWQWQLEQPEWKFVLWSHIDCRLSAKIRLCVKSIMLKTREEREISSGTCPSSMVAGA